MYLITDHRNKSLVLLSFATFSLNRLQKSKVTLHCNCCLFAAAVTLFALFCSLSQNDFAQPHLFSLIDVGALQDSDRHLPSFKEEGNNTNKSAAEVAHTGFD